MILSYFPSGAGAAVDFLNLVGGTTQPTSAANYTVWANTSVAVGVVTWEASAPASPAAGDMWVKLGTSSATPIPVNTENTAWVYPVEVQQYSGTAWETKTAQTYQNGIWKEWDVALYNLGDENTEVTGGWAVYPAANSGTITKNAQSITVTQTGQYSAGKAAPIKNADLSAYSTLYIHVVSIAKGAASLALKPDTTGTGSDIATATLQVGDNNVDISAVTQSAWVVLQAYLSSNGGKITFDKVKLFA